MERDNDSACIAYARIERLTADLAFAVANPALPSFERNSDAPQLAPHVRAPTPRDITAVVAAITIDDLRGLPSEQLRLLARLAARIGNVLTAMLLLRCVHPG
jgi:hypothetical protein